MFNRHPKRTLDNISNEQLDQTFKQIFKKKKNFCGDVNYNLLNYECNTNISEFIDIMYSGLFKSCTIEPTRMVEKNRSSVIDNISFNTISTCI